MDINNKALSLLKRAYTQMYPHATYALQYNAKNPKRPKAKFSNTVEDIDKGKTLNSPIALKHTVKNKPHGEWSKEQTHLYPNPRTITGTGNGGELYPEPRNPFE